jgi:hypothetical protein
VAVAETHSDDPGRVRVNRGLGDGRLEFVRHYFPGDYPVGIVAADFDGDGRVDLALPCQRLGTIGVLMNSSDTPSPRQLVATVESADVISGAARIEWAAPGIGAARVERADHGKRWAAFGNAALLPSGNLAVEDAAMEPGRRYGYRLVSIDPRVEIEGSEVWLKSLPRGGIKVHELAETDARGGGVALVIDTDEPGDAVIDVFDLSGRRVVAGRHVRLTAGAQRVGLGVNETLGQGVFWVRVKRGGDVGVGRVVVVR